MTLTKEIKSSPDYIAIDARVKEKIKYYENTLTTEQKVDPAFLKDFVKKSVEEYSTVASKCGLTPLTNSANTEFNWEEIFIKMYIKEEVLVNIICTDNDTENSDDN